MVLASPEIDRVGRPPRPPATLSRGAWLQLLVLALPGVIAFVIWRVSLAHVELSSLGSYGLPPALPRMWYLALLITVVGFVTATTARRTNALVMVGYLAVLVIILYGTVPALSGPPHYAWVYKHIGVVRYLETHGQVNPAIDIYNRWPGFFAFGAVFSVLGGAPNPETYASWAEPVFCLLDAIVLVTAVKSLTRNVRIAAVAGLLFVVTNWVGQTYYSPQAFSFLLGLVVILMILRHLRVDRPRYAQRVRRVLERVGRIPQLQPLPRHAATWSRSAAAITVLSLDAIIVASHQLTPYMLLVSVALLTLVGVARPWWMLLGMGVLTFSYLGANYSFIKHNYGVFTSIDPFNNAQGQGATITKTPTAGKSFNTDVELLLIAAMWLTTLCAVIRLLRRGLLLRALPFTVLVVSPFVVLFGQNYGGEASLRIILFSSPWCAALTAWALVTIDRRRLRVVLTASVALTFTALFVPSFLGQEELNIISPGEVRASDWFYSHARPGTVLVLAAPGFPFRYGAAYPAFLGPEGDANPNLLTEPVFVGRPLGAAEVPNVAARIMRYATHGYIVFDTNETRYAEVFRLTPPGALGHLEAAVARSREFRLWYRNEDVRVYELAPRAPAGRGPATPFQPLVMRGSPFAAAGGSPGPSGEWARVR